MEKIAKNPVYIFYVHISSHSAKKLLFSFFESAKQSGKKRNFTFFFFLFFPLSRSPFYQPIGTHMAENGALFLLPHLPNRFFFFLFYQVYLQKKKREKCQVYKCTLLALSLLFLLSLHTMSFGRRCMQSICT